MKCWTLFCCDDLAMKVFGKYNVALIQTQFVHYQHGWPNSVKLAITVRLGEKWNFNLCL